MNHIQNERGETIIAVGAEGSHARMATKYPDTILILMMRLNDEEPLLVKYCRLHNVNSNDMHSLIKAAMYYFNNKIEPHK